MSYSLGPHGLCNQLGSSVHGILRARISSVQFICSVVFDSTTPWTAAHQASLSITNSWSLLKLMFIESVMPSNHLILCCPLLLSPLVFPSIRVFLDSMREQDITPLIKCLFSFSAVFLILAQWCRKPSPPQSVLQRHESLWPHVASEHLKHS